MDLVAWNGMPSGIPTRARVTAVTASYVVGKGIWSLSSKLIGQKQTYPKPFTDPGEVAAVGNTIAGVRFSSVFSTEWLQRYCPE